MPRICWHTILTCGNPQWYGKPLKQRGLLSRGAPDDTIMSWCYSAKRANVWRTGGHLWADRFQAHRADLAAADQGAPAQRCTCGQRRRAVCRTGQAGRVSPSYFTQLAEIGIITIEQLAKKAVTPLRLTWARHRKLRRSAGLSGCLTLSYPLSIEDKGGLRKVRRRGKFCLELSGGGLHHAASVRD